MSFFNRPVPRACAALLLLAGFVQGALGASKRIELVAEACNYAVRFDPARTDEAQVRDTFEFLVVANWRTVFGYPAFSVGDIKSIDLAQIEHQCAESLAGIKALKLLPIAGVEQRREAVIAEIEDSCRYERLNAQAYRNPSVLRQYTPAASCMRYVDALEGKSDLTAAYDEISRGCEENVNPKSCLAEVQRKRGNVEDMKVDVHNFGWSSCANDFTLRNTAKNAEKARQLGQAFLKTYKARMVNCEEP